MRDIKFLRVFAYSLLLSTLIVTTSYASSNSTNSDIYTPPSGPSFDSTKSQEVIFKTPSGLMNDSSKESYKASVALPENNAWTLQQQQESNSQFTPKIIKKDDSNFLSILSTNQFPTQTIRVVIDKIDLVDVDSRFYRIPNIKTEATNDYVYLPKSTTQLAYKPSADEIKSYDPNNTSTIYLSNKDGQYSLANPEDKEYQVAMIQEKVGSNDWAFSKPLQLNLTASTPENTQEADKIVKNSNFDNQNSQLVAPISTTTPKQEGGENKDGTTDNGSKSPDQQANNKQPSTGSVGGLNILPYIATLAGFGVLNLGIRQYFKKN
ncbi:MAG: hypothetical protein ACRCXZ_01670 [Patescibacteria group bacterium]